MYHMCSMHDMYYPTCYIHPTSGYALLSPDSRYHLIDGTNDRVYCILYRVYHMHYMYYMYYMYYPT